VVFLDVLLTTHSRGQLLAPPKLLDVGTPSVAVVHSVRHERLPDDDPPVLIIGRPVAAVFTSAVVSGARERLSSGLLKTEDKNVEPIRFVIYSDYL
jgi:hypothetical protein